MTSIRDIFASLFIVITTLSTASGAENIYKCGTSYSQTPCADGKVLTIKGTGDAQQKKVVDANTRRDAKLAKDMEKARLAQEHANRPAPTQPKTHAKQSGESVIAVAPTPTPTTITPKRVKPKPYKPAGFVAVVPGSDSAHAQLKKPSKKVAAKAQ